MYIMPDKLFRKLNPDEESQFRQYARDNDPPDIEKWGIYHPVCRDEWRKRGIDPDTPRQSCNERRQRGLCPVCGARVRLKGDTTDGRYIATCGDAFTSQQWRS